LGEPCWWYVNIVISSETNMILTLSPYSIGGQWLSKDAGKNIAQSDA
jgi:hypothetical protein